MDGESRNGMDNTILYVMMICVGLLNAAIPFGVFLGLATLMNIDDVDTRLIVITILAVLIVTFLGCLGAFAIVQSTNCGQVKNMKQVASNAGLALGIQAFLTFIVWLIPGLRGIVSGLLPPDTDPKVLEAFGYSYFAFFGGLFGVAIGGTLSGICN